MNHTRQTMVASKVLTKNGCCIEDLTAAIVTVSGDCTLNVGGWNLHFVTVNNAAGDCSHFIWDASGWVNPVPESCWRLS